jgi:DNA invertase Pin-like site-specific DNA recombinase
MRVALYARVSTDDKGQDPENQLPRLREFAAARGWRIEREYVDQESAALGKAHRRPAFREMLREAWEGGFDVLLFWSLDRFTREGALPTLELLNRLSGSGVKWQSFTEQYLSTLGVWGDAIVAVLATIARQETIRQSERVKAGIARRRAKGLPVGRQRRLFRRDEARELRRQGFSWRAIAERLGVPHPTVIRAVRELEGGP